MKDELPLYAVYYDTCHLPGAAVVRAASPEDAIKLVRNAPDPNDPSATLERECLEARLLDAPDGAAVLFDFHFEE